MAELTELSAEACAALEILEAETIASRLAPPPRLTVSEWADTKRQLSREASAEPGQWRTSRAPYQRGILDAFSDPTIEEVVVMTSSQVGKTEAVLNVIGFFGDQDPAPLLVILPTISEAEQWSKTRLATMIRDTPALAGRFRDPRSRDSGNTILVKEFPGGHITLVGANAPSGLAAKPIRIVLGDEIDRFPRSAGTEGDPITLARRRTATFWNRKLGWFSSPTLKGLSRIEAAFAEGDQRYYLVPCPGCGHLQRLLWPQLRWENHRPATASYACVGCGDLIPETQKTAMLAAGRWVAAAPEHVRVASFHLNALYSPWARWADLATEWLAAQGNLERLQVFVNTVLGEVWEERGGQYDPTLLEQRQEAYDAEVPAGVQLLTCGVDVQDDRLEYVVRGWGPGEESWLIRFDRILGDPSIAVGKPDSPWTAFDREVRLRDWTTPSGAHRIAVTCIDSGYHTDAVYAYTGPRSRQRVYATKGSSTPGKPLLPRRPSRNNKGKVPLFELGTDTAKDLLHSRLKVSQPGPLYMHVPHPVPLEWAAQVTSEKKIRRLVNGRWRSNWVLPTGQRNEALDCEVLALVAMRLAPVRLAAGQPAASARVTASPEEPTSSPPTSGPEHVYAKRRALKAPRSGRWLHGWRR